MPEYIYTDLPQYVKVQSRTEFSSSVVSSGAVLLFSENGSSLTAKLPDGSFVNVGGSGSGIDPSSTTAEAGDVLSGKVFYTSGGSLTSGTIPTVSATLSGGVVTVPSGYIATSQTLTVPEASSATVSGGEVTIPAGYVSSAYTVSAGGASVDYFQCNTVSSGGSTWNGYRAVLSGGSYSLESALTSGLSFGPVTPVSGQIYTDGALVRIASLYGLLPTSGLVFYAPLATSAGTAATGQTLTIPSGATFATVGGIPCVNLNGGNISASDAGLPSGNHAVTLSIWIRFNSTPNDWTGLFGYGTSGEYGQSFYVFMDPDNEFLAGGSYMNVGEGYGGATSGQWYHVVARYNGSYVALFINSILIAQSQESLDLLLNELYLGLSISVDTSFAGARIYNRALTDAEIGQLYAEFSPT